MSELITVAGIIALGVNGGLLQAYFSNPHVTYGTSSTFVNNWIPTTINGIITFSLLWGLLSSEKDPGMKTIYTFLLLVLSTTELYFVYADKTSEDKTYSPVGAQIVLFMSSIFKLFLIVSLHCSTIGPTSNDFFSKFKLPKIKREPTKPLEKESKREERDKEPEIDGSKALRLFNLILEKTDLPKEEKLLYREKMEIALSDTDAWQKSSNLFSNILQKVTDEEMSVDDKTEVRNKFRYAMGRPSRGGR
jgi:hypothetical protein